jgi:predicted DNA-binding ribbon-helix-helix protein
MKVKLTSRTVNIDGRRTTLRMEQVSWDVLGDICESEGLTVNELISLVDRRRHNGSRTSAVRAFIVTYLHELATETGSLWKVTVSSVLSG